jgi:hypothetical protein
LSIPQSATALLDACAASPSLPTTAVLFFNPLMSNVR